MNRLQKIAWFNLIVLLVSLALTGAAVGILAVIIGMPRALGGCGFLGISGLLGLAPILFRKKQGQPELDERDLLIFRRASLVAYSIFWVYFTFACMAPWLILDQGATIRVVMLPGMLAGGFVIVQLIQSIAVLVQYGRGGKDG